MGWTIAGVFDDRKQAIENAEKIWTSKRYRALKVVKEAFDVEENNFSSVEIFSRGAVRKVSKYDESGTIAPCLSPDDLYSPDGRRSLWDLMANTFKDWFLTPTELLHSLYHYYKLYNAGSKLQNAIQRTAVSMEEEETSVQQRMRRIEKLIDAAVNILKSVEEDIPSLEMGRLKPIIEELDEKPNRRFLLLCSLADYLRPAVTLGDKFGRTIIFLSSRRPPWVLEILDQLISEFLMHERLFYQLIGETDDRGLFLSVLAHLQAGELNLLSENGKAIKFNDDLIRLNGFLSEGLLPETARVIMARFVAELEAPKQINSRGLLAQLEAIGDLRTLLANMKTDIHTLDNIDDALFARAGRLINSQSIGELLYDIKDPFDQIDMLLNIEAATIGISNKRTVINFLLPILSMPNYEAIFLGVGTSPTQAMNALVMLQKRIISADLPEMYGRKVSEKLDGFCKTILDNTQILKKIHEIDGPVQEKAKRLLRMIADGYFTEGDSLERAEHQARLYMKQDGFTEGLIIGLTRGEQEKALIDFRRLLEDANIQKACQG